MSEPAHLRPGERLFALLLVVCAGYLLYESYLISGFEGLATGGVMPMLAAGVMLISSVFIFAETCRKSRMKGTGVVDLIRFLLPLPVVLFTALIAAYALAIPQIGFLAASGVFIFTAVWMLLRKGPLFATLIAAGSVVTIHLLFRMIFQVVLPAGSLWQ